MKTMLNNTEVTFLLGFIDKEIDELMKGDWNEAREDVAELHSLAAKLIHLQIHNSTTEP